MENEALEAMFKHVESLDILPAWFPNIEEDNEGNRAPNYDHFRVFVLPVDADNNITLCGQKARYRWLLQISIYVRDGVGQIKAAQYVDQLRAATLPNQNILSGINEFRIDGIGQTSPAIQADGWFIYPVRFSIEFLG